jgi:formylglycine-generating enzyme required for sulfatase activity
MADARRLPGFNRRQILDLDDEQRRLFLQRYHQRLFDAIPDRAAAESERLLEAMATHRALYNLGRTPLMLLGLAVVHYREERLPHGRDEVFRALTGAVLELRFRSDDERKLQARRLQAIAVAMHERSEQERDVSLPVLHGMVSDVLTAETGKPPCEREIQTCLDQLLGVSGLVEADERSARFIHLGFQEYLAAQALAYRFQGRFGEDQVRDCFLDDEWWRESMAMLVSLLSRGETGYEGVNLWREIYSRRSQGQAPVARLAQLAESLQEIEPQRRLELAAEEQQLEEEIIAMIEDPAQPGALEDRISAAEALGRLGDRRCSQLPPAMVDIGNGLQASAYPITVAQYRLFVDAGGYKPEIFGEERWAAWQSGIDALLADKGYSWAWEYIRSTKERSAPAGWPAQLWTPNRPVAGVSWYEACAFCEWLTATAGDVEYRLPTEDEWQQAARGMQRNQPYPWGKEEPGKGPTARANYYDLGMKERGPTPVGLFPSGAAPWGEDGDLQDMAGNVWDWCADEQSGDGQPKVGGLFRPLRGGSCWVSAEYLEVSYRRWRHAAYWYVDGGFRVVRRLSRRRPPVLDP